MLTKKNKKLVYIKKDASFDGIIESSDNIYLEGNISGEIKTEKDVYVLKGAILNSNLTAENIQVFGAIKGNLTAKKRIIINEAARVYGNINCESLRLLEGACYSGKMEVTVFSNK
ncbi:MAG: polymer-forming cytoskeletal protein [Candidatus Margulisbacteria bacterium]|nr:polymer-forming cytoskeletal protein [Candidatus Margulisiibacteriota bacterium]